MRHAYLHKTVFKMNFFELEAKKISVEKKRFFLCKTNKKHLASFA